MNPCPILRGLPSSLHYLPQHTSCLNDSVCCRFCFRRLLLSCFFTDYSQGRLHNCSLYAPPCSSVPIPSATIRTLLLFACYYSPTSWLVRGRTRYKVYSIRGRTIHPRLSLFHAPARLSYCPSRQFIHMAALLSYLLHHFSWCSPLRYFYSHGYFSGYFRLHRLTFSIDLRNKFNPYSNSLRHHTTIA